MIQKKLLILQAAVMMTNLSVLAQNGDVNSDGIVDVADITAVIKIMKDSGGTATVGSCFYLGTTKPTEDNYKTLPGLITSYTSINDAIGTTVSVDAGQTLYMLCPTKWIEGKNVGVEYKAGASCNSLEADYTTISDYTIYETQAWSDVNNITLKVMSSSTSEVISGEISGEYAWYNGEVSIPSGSTVTNTGDIDLNLYEVHKGGTMHTTVAVGQTVTIGHAVTAIRSKRSGGKFCISCVVWNGANDIVLTPTMPFKTGHSENLADGDVIELESNSLANYKKYVVNIAKVNTMGVLRLYHGDAASQYKSGYLELTDTSVKIYRYYSDKSSYELSYAHGITISDRLQLIMTVEDRESNATIELTSNGVVFTREGVNWTPCNGMVKLVCVSGSFNDVEFSYGTTHYDKDVLLMGASYMGHASPKRWPYYLVENGYKNYILNAFPGAKSNNGLNDLNVLLTHFTPKSVFWGYGMNNPDTENAVNEDWFNKYIQVRQICESKNIELILMTYPTVRGGVVDDTDISNKRINKWKNAIVRASGLRYVDIDKAVGADEDTGEWYSDMLDTDGVHPTKAGAMAMFDAVMDVIPELARE